MVKPPLLNILVNLFQVSTLLYKSLASIEPKVQISLLTNHATEAHNVNLLLLIDRHGSFAILNVNNGRLRLPGRNLAIEQDVAFTVRAVFQIRKKAECHHPADASGTSPNVTAPACEV